MISKDTNLHIRINTKTKKELQIIAKKKEPESIENS